MFTKAIVRKPCKNMVNGITTSDLGKPDFEKACIQHKNYIETLKKCGVEVFILEADERFPDSVFVEDTAVLTSEFALITNPGANSRNQEIIETEKYLKKFYTEIERISAPGTLDGGDVMQVGTHFFIGLSQRTNSAGAEQFISILHQYGMSGEVVELKKVLHLKTGVVYIENNNLVVSGEFIDKSNFRNFNKIIVDSDESYSANCIWFNGKVIVPLGFPKSKQRIEDAGYETVELDMSEFRKLDGGLSCLSLRF
jgi:dimethylargininase